MIRDPGEKPVRAVVTAVQLPGAGDVEFEASLTELRQLAKTLGFEVVATLTVEPSDGQVDN
jgi:GTP-binding protein HflX